MLLFCDCTWSSRAAREDLSLLYNTSVSAGKWKTSPYFFPTSLAVGVKESAFSLSHWKQVSHFLKKHPKSLTASYFQRCYSRQAEYSSDGFDSLYINIYIYIYISSHSSVFTVLALTQMHTVQPMPQNRRAACSKLPLLSIVVHSPAWCQQWCSPPETPPSLVKDFTAHTPALPPCLLFVLQPWLNK